MMGERAITRHVRNHAMTPLAGPRLVCLMWTVGLGTVTGGLTHNTHMPPGGMRNQSPHALKHIIHQPLISYPLHMIGVILEPIDMNIETLTLDYSLDAMLTSIWAGVLRKWIISTVLAPEENTRAHPQAGELALEEWTPLKIEGLREILRGEINLLPDRSTEKLHTGPTGTKRTDTTLALRGLEEMSKEMSLKKWTLIL